MPESNCALKLSNNCIPTIFVQRRGPLACLVANTNASQIIMSKLPLKPVERSSMRNSLSHVSIPSFILITLVRFYPFISVPQSHSHTRIHYCLTMSTSPTNALLATTTYEKTQIEIFLEGPSSSEMHCSVLVRCDSEDENLESVIRLPIYHTSSSSTNTSRQRRSKRTSRRSRFADLFRNPSPVLKNRRSFRDGNYRKQWGGSASHNVANKSGSFKGMFLREPGGDVSVASTITETSFECDPCLGGYQYRDRRASLDMISFTKPAKKVERVVHTRCAAPPNEKL